MPPNMRCFQVSAEHECYVDHTTTILGQLDVGRFSYISDHGFVFGRSKIQIGSFCSIGPYFHCVTHEQHPTVFPSTFPLAQVVGVPLTRGDVQGLDVLGNVVDEKPVTIGNDVWIGEGVSIAGGLTIGDGCIIGAKSMVTRDCVPYGVYVGTPAKLIRMRFPELVVEQLLEIKWWEWPLAKIRASAAFFETDLCTYVGDLQDLIRPEPIAA